MAVFCAVEFPLEDAKSRGPHIVPESKVKKENGSSRVLWKVVDENGELTEAQRKSVANLLTALRNRVKRPRSVINRNGDERNLRNLMTMTLKILQSSQQRKNYGLNFANFH